MAAGFTQEQAEVQAETFLSIVQDQLVSKRDLKEVEKTLELKIETVKKDLKVEIEVVKRDLKIWFGGMLFAAVAALIMTLIARVSH